ncbi:MAG: RNA polymerase subunit sigma-24 [Acidobacteria bacterium]|nr:MAG: RNA polymerase subunit sigma-24 [Acidobacteriota bacterium]
MEALVGEAGRRADAPSLEASVTRNRRRLLDFIRRRIGNESDAEDVLQDVLLQLVASYSVTEPIEKLTAWLFTVARNRVVDWYRKRRPAPARERTADDRKPISVDDVLFDPADGPDHAYWRSAVWAELEDALDELPGEQRSVFIAHELEGASFKEIAGRTGVPLSTLLSRKHYAVLFLRQRLQDLYNELDRR